MTHNRVKDWQSTAEMGNFKHLQSLWHVHSAFRKGLFSLEFVDINRAGVDEAADESDKQRELSNLKDSSQKG